MGLDSYFFRLEIPDDMPDVNLCGGLFSGNGKNASFRGKAYANLIESITGVSLYQTFAGPDFSLEIYEGLEEFKNSVDRDVFLDTIEEHNITEQEYNDLITIFKHAYEKGYLYHGWW